MSESTPLAPTAVLTVNRALPQRELMGQHIFVNPRRRETVTLDELATWLVTQVDGATPLITIAERCAAQFDVSAKQALGDTRDLFEGLMLVGLLKPVGP